MDLLTKAVTILSKFQTDRIKFIKYLGIGIITTLADWVAFYVLISFLHVFYLPALAISYLASTVLSFFLNKHYTFQNNYKKVHVQFASFVIVAAIGLCLNEALIFSMVRYLFGSGSDFTLMTARIIATLIVFLWNFGLNERITFHIFK